MSCKTLFINLDGADSVLIQRWARAGKLPHLARLIKEWSMSDMVAPDGFGDGVFWTSVYTGVGAGKHGHYFPRQFNPITYELYDHNIDDQLGRDSFWQICSKVGRKVGVIDLCYAPLNQGLNGVQVMDWMVHDRMGEPRSWPTALIKRLHQKYMQDPLNGCSEAEGRSEQEWVQFHADLIARMRAKTSAVCSLLHDNDWDLFCVGFSDAHDVGHQSWHWHDESDPEHPKGWADKHGDPILQVYQALDNSIAEVLENAQAEDVVLIAGLGMTRQISANSALQQILAHYSGVSGDRQTVTEKRREMPYFELPHNMIAGAIRINLQGRESLGVVAEQEFTKVCDGLIERLMAITDIDTGQRIVKKVIKISERYTGRLNGNLPDIMVIWDRRSPMQTLVLDDGHTINVEPIFMPERRSGDHTQAAMLLTSRQYLVDDVVRAEMIAPTICRSLGINMPATDSKALCLLSKEHTQVKKTRV